ncbi:MAG: PAS domain-containing protein, partial [Rhodospirillales bacterium]|nr:PAS domain-containing protein [Rhodospirillales bacterium]
MAADKQSTDDRQQGPQTLEGHAHADAIAPVPEFLHGGSKVIAQSQSGGSAASVPKPEAFRPPRGPGPGVFAFVAGLFLGVGVAWQQGMLAAPPFGFSADMAALGAWTVAALFVVLAAWGAGRRMRADDEALLVHLAAGEGGAPLMVSTPTGRVLYANRAFRALFKSQAAAEVPSAFRLSDGDEDSSAVIGRMLAAAGGGAQDHEELAFAFPGGGREWHRLSVRPVVGVRGLVAWSADDVTARRELDEIRRREEALLADLLDNLPVGFFSVDGTGRIVFANETLSAWLGIGLNDIRERGLSFADFVVDSGGHEDDEDGLHGQVTLQ